MFEKVKDSIRSWVISNILTTLLGSAVVGAVVNALAGSFLSLPVAWRAALSLSVVLLCYAGFWEFGKLNGWGIGGGSSQNLRAERQTAIENWRKMISEVHLTHLAYHQSGAPQTIASLLEKRSVFWSLRPHLSRASSNALFGRTVIVPPDQSKMDGTLHSILEDIDELEKKWGLRS